MASVRWSNVALRHISTLDPLIRGRILNKVTWLGENFVDVVPEFLHHKLKGLYKLRIGDYRVVYSLQANIIIVEDVRHRRDIYR